LFNVTADPYEQEDLSKSNPVVAAKLQKLLLGYVFADDYMPEQSPAIDEDGLPENNDGVWAPWLDD
jgi:hypothetical protein